MDDSFGWVGEGEIDRERLRMRCQSIKLIDGIDSIVFAY